MKLAARAIFKQGRCVVYQVELLHAGDGWLHVIGIPDHLVLVFNRFKRYSILFYWSKGWEGVDGNSIKSSVKIANNVMDGISPCLTVSCYF